MMCSAEVGIDEALVDPESRNGILILIRTALSGRILNLS